MRHCFKIIIPLVSLAVLAATAFASTDLRRSPVPPPDLPATLSTPVSVPQPATTSSADNPAFEQIVNLGVPAGNGATPWRLAVNSQAGLVYILTEGLPVLQQGNGISVYNIETGEIVEHVKINQGSPSPLDLQFDPETGLLYVLWQQGYSGESPPHLTVIDGQSLQVIRQIPAVEAIAVAGGLLYAVNQDRLITFAVEAGTVAQRNQLSLPAATQIGRLAVNPAANRLYLARADDGVWTMDVFEADTLTLLDSYTANETILDILPNPASGQVFVVETAGDARVLTRLTADGHPTGITPYELGPRFGAGGIALSSDGKRLYFSNGELPPSGPVPSENTTGPAFIGLTTTDLAPLYRIPLPTNFEDLVVNAKTGQAFAVYPFSDVFYVIDPDHETVRTVSTAIEIRDVLVDAEGNQIFVSDSAHRIRRLNRETFAVLAETRPGASTQSYGFEFGPGPGELALDRNRNRLYVSGNPALVLEAGSLAEIAALDPGGQFALDPGGDKVYLSHCGVAILEAQTLISETVIPGSGPRNDQLVPNPCVTYSQLDPANRLLYSIVPNGVPGSNGGNYLYVYDLSAGPRLIFTDTDISIGQALPDPTNRRAFVSYVRYDNRRLRTLTVPSTGPISYTHQLVGVWGEMLYNPQTNRLYLSDSKRLLALDAGTLDVVGEMPLPPQYDYEVVALDSTHDRLYLAGYDGKLLIASGRSGRSRRENLAALLATGDLSPPAAQVPNGPISDLESTANGPVVARISTDEYYGESRLFLTTDEGGTWVDLSKNMPPFPVEAMAVSASYEQDQTLFAALVTFGETGGLYRSTDGGQTWVAAMAGLRDLWVNQLFISPEFRWPPEKAGPESGLIFADTVHTGLQYSVDGGQTWNPLSRLDPNNSLPTTGFGAAAIGSNGVILASHPLKEMYGLFRASVEADGSLSNWQQVLDVPLTLLAIASDGLTAFGFGNGLWRSADGGLTWQPGGAGLTDLDRFQARRFLFSPTFAGDHTIYLFLRAIRGDESGRLFRSTDAGLTWQPWAKPPADNIFTAVTLAPDGDFLFGDAEAHLTRLAVSDITWAELQPVSMLFPVDDLAASPDYTGDGTLFAISHQYGLFKSGDGGRTWEQTGFPVRSTSFEGYRLAISPAYRRDQTLYVATGFSLHRSTDGGRNWQNLQLEPSQGFGLQAEQIVLSPDFARDRTLLVSTPKAIFRSTDRGDTWRQVLTRPKEVGPARILDFSPSGDIAYAWFDYDSTLFVSDDGGQSWQPQPGSQDEYFSIAAAAVSPDGALTISPGFSSQLLQVSDRGQNRQVLTETLPDNFADLQTMAYTSDGALLIGGQGGLFQSGDNGQSWQPITGLPAGANVTRLRLTDAHLFVVLAEGSILVSDDGGASWSDISVVK